MSVFGRARLSALGYGARIDAPMPLNHRGERMKILVDGVALLNVYVLLVAILRYLGCPDLTWEEYDPLDEPGAGRAA